MCTLEELEKMFLQHAEKDAKDNQEWIKAFLNNYPGEPIPEHLADDFSLPKALAHICSEIINLKK